MISIISGIDLNSCTSSQLNKQLEKLGTVHSRYALLNLATEATKLADDDRKIASEYSSKMQFALKLFSIVSVAGAAFIFLTAIFAHAAITSSLLAGAITLELLNGINITVAVNSLIKNNFHLNRSQNYKMIATAAKIRVGELPLKYGQGFLSGLFVSLFYYSSPQETRITPFYR